VKRIRIEITEEELERCTPQAQEALLRLAREQNPEHFVTDSRSANERLRDGIKRGPTEAEYEARRAKVAKPDGITIIQQPNITPRR